MAVKIQYSGGNSSHMAEAIIVLPAAIDGSVCDQRVGAWLARGDLERCDTTTEILSRVVEAVGQPECHDGHAALRFWGQNGARPTVWMAAADPVHLEARLDHLRLHCLSVHERRDQDLRQLLDELQTALAQDAGIKFVSVESCGYLQADSPMPTALYSPTVAIGRDPIAMLPTGPEAGGFQRLLSEIQMALHNSEINRVRENQNLRTINSLWIWGGGSAAEAIAREIPPLFADDSVLQGYWLSSNKNFAPWPGSLNQCTDRAPTGFVAVTPEQPATAEEYAETLTAYLRELRQILKHSDLRSMTLLFRQGLTARIRPRQIFRVWRREIPDLAGGVAA